MSDNVDTSIFYDIKRTLTHNCLFNFIVGSRGVGKTFAFKKWAVEDFLKTGKQFVYVRRYEKESSDSTQSFWRDISEQFPDNVFTVRGRKLYIDHKVAGYSIVLSTAKIKKSVSYPNVNKICFDEFLIEKGVFHYLPDDVGAFLNLYETIARPGSGHCDVITFFMANAITWTNPYFLYFRARVPQRRDKNNKLIWKRGDILVELTDGNGFTDHKRATRFGQIIDGTSYGAYSIDNQFLLDDDTFIEKKSPVAKYFFTFKFKGGTYGVWGDFNQGKLWVSKSVDPSYVPAYALTLKDHSPNTVYIKRILSSGRFKTFIEYYKQGQVGFESMDLKNITYDAIRMALT